MKLLDKYIIRKFLGTFFFFLALIIVITIVFDISEKLDDFIEENWMFEKIKEFLPSDIYHFEEISYFKKHHFLNLE